MKKPKTPTGLGKEGKRLWKKYVDNYTLSDHGLTVLEQACFSRDRLSVADKKMQRVNEDDDHMKVNSIKLEFRSAQSTYMQSLRMLTQIISPPSYKAPGAKAQKKSDDPMGKVLGV